MNEMISQNTDMAILLLS